MFHILQSESRAAIAESRATRPGDIAERAGLNMRAFGESRIRASILIAFAQAVAILS